MLNKREMKQTLNEAIMNKLKELFNKNNTFKLRSLFWVFCSRETCVFLSEEMRAKYGAIYEGQNMEEQITIEKLEGKVEKADDFTKLGDTLERIRSTEIDVS